MSRNTWFCNRCGEYVEFGDTHECVPTARCQLTGHICGTDTWPKDYVHNCEPCVTAVYEAYQRLRLAPPRGQAEGA